MNSSLEEKRLSSSKVYNGKLLKVFKDTVSLPNGKTSAREYIKHPGAVCIFALNENRDVIIEKQFRYPFDCVVTELPAGKLDESDASPLEAAKRELREETGYTADDWQYLGSYYPTVAYTNEVIHLFLAQKLHRGERHLDNDEFLDVVTMPFDELINLVLDNKLPDGKTQTAVLKAAALLQRRF